MPVFHQPIRTEHQPCSIAQSSGMKIPREFEKRWYDDAQKFFGKDAMKLNKKETREVFQGY